MFISSIRSKKLINLKLHNKASLAVLFSLLLFSCSNKQPTQEQVVVSPPVQSSLSPLPLEGLTVIDYKFAQAVLNQLGYEVGYIDGIWGPRSATALQQFESDYQLTTSNGRLSELNYTRLNDNTTLKKEEFASSSQPQVQTPVQSVKKIGITSKLDPSLALSSSPQLIITDYGYSILAKPNPYSETILDLPEGAGLYIIDLQDGWYEVETLERQRGYIQN